MRSAPLVALAALLAPACAGSDGPRASVLLVVVDSLRADHLGCYGARRPTPAVDALARQGALFERARSSAPWTKPSVASLLTARHPTAHGVTDTRAVLAGELETLAEVLADAGWATAAVVSHHFVGARFGFDQGFASFDQEAARGHGFVSSVLVTDKAVRFLEERARAEDGRPFFLLAHYFDPHYDYQDHAQVPYAAARAGRLDGSQGIGQLRRLLPDMTAEERAFLLDRYDEEIRFADLEIGRLLSRLRRLGLAADTLVAFTADHGEGFGERGYLGHTESLHEELVRVPLVLAGPGVAAGTRRAEPVSLVGLAPTLLELAGGPPLAAAQVASFADLARGVPGAQGESTVFCELDYLGAAGGEPGLPTVREKAVARGRWKLVRDDGTGRVALFDLESDPGERVDRAAAEPEVARELAALLDAHLGALARAARPAERAELDAAETESLRQLGYVGDE